MNENRTSYDEINSALNYALKLNSDILLRKYRPIHITENYSLTNYIKQHFANSKEDDTCNIVGVDVCTLQEWICSCWELFGNGCDFVSDSTQKLILTNLLSKNKNNLCSKGIVDSVSEIAKHGLSSIVKKDKNCFAQLSDNQLEIAKILCQYFEVLQSNNLTTLNCAIDFLFDKKDFIKYISKYEFCFTWLDTNNFLVTQVLALLKNNGITYHLIEQSNNPHVNINSVDYIGTTGESVLSKAYYETVLQLCKIAKNGEISSTLAVSHNPYDLFKDINNQLVNNDIDVLLNSNINLMQIPIAKLFVNLINLYEWNESRNSPLELAYLASDIAFIECSGIDYKAAEVLNEKWLEDRTLTKEIVIDDLCKNCNPTFKTDKSDSEEKVNIMQIAFNYLRQNNYKALLDTIYCFSDCDEMSVINNGAHITSEPDEMSVLNNNAYKTINSFIDNYYCHLYSIHDVLLLLQGISVPLKIIASDKLGYESLTDNTTTDNDKISTSYVEITTPGNACSQSYEKYDNVIWLDLSQNNYPLNIEDDAVSRFLKVFDIEKNTDLLTEAKQKIVKVCNTAKQKVIVGMSETSFDSEENYESVLLTQLKSVASFNNIKNYSEDDCNNTLWITEPNYVDSTTSVTFSFDKNQVATYDKFLINKTFSASAIERLICCPFSWYSNNILGTSTIGADFSALEKGSFIHQVFKTFYLELKTKNIERVTSENLNICLDIMSNVFQKCLGAQYESKYSGRLIAITNAEKGQLDMLKDSALQMVKRDATFMENFAPRYFEQKFGFDKAVKYAGKNVRGSIDRIDVDDDGNCIVIDYKSSSNNIYQADTINEDIFGLGISLPDRIQALVYAQIAGRELGLNPVAAIYRGYKNAIGTPDNPGAAGVVDLGQIDLGDGANMDYIKVDKCSVNNMTEYLDNTEEQIKQLLQKVDKREVMPMPVNKGACQYCDIINCKARTA